MTSETGARRIYRARVVRRRRSALAVVLAVAVTAVVLVTARRGDPQPLRVKYDRAAAVRYADEWALKDNPEYWSSPDSDCANFVSQCLAAGGLRSTFDAGREWRSNGTEFPTVAWVNCGAQQRALSSRGAAHSRYIVGTSHALPAGWAAGDIVYLGNEVDGKLEWQHVIICAGKRDGSWVYDSHTTAYRRTPLSHWYPAHFSEVSFCHVAGVVTYDAAD